MVSNAYILKMASVFAKFAQEVDSTYVTLAARPVANSVIDKMVPVILNSITPMLTVPNTTVTLGGVLTLDAVKSGNAWKITKLNVPGSVTGDGAENTKLVNALEAGKSKIKAQLTPAIEKEFARLAKNFGDAKTITNFEVETNSQNISSGG